MVSDILSDAAHQIREWLEEPPYKGADAKTLRLIYAALEHMDEARKHLDTPPKTED